jgi:hypothetical protein
VAIPVALATGRTVIGIDSSPAMLAQARAAAAAAGVALDLREGDIVTLSSMSQRASPTVPSGRSFTSRRGPTEGVCSSVLLVRFVQVAGSPGTRSRLTITSPPA